jgi:hypothetical protein
MDIRLIFYGLNVHDTPMDEEWIFSSKSAHIFYSVFMDYILVAFISLEFIELITWVHYTVVLGGVVPFLIYGHIKHPKDIYSPAIGTKPVK